MSMDSRWERGPYHEIERLAAANLVRSWFPGHSLEECRLITQGRRNTNYRITVKGSAQTYLLRIYQDNDHSWKKEKSLAGLLAGSVPLPEVLYAAHDPRILPKPFAIFEFIEGRNLDELLSSGYAPDKTLLQQIGECLARIHGFQYPIAGFLNESLRVDDPLPPLFSLYDMFLDERTVARLGEEAAGQLRKFIVQNRDLIEEMDREITLVQGDYRPANLLVHQDRLAAIVDWEHAMAGHPFSDLGQFIRYPDQIPPALEKSFIQGYTKIRALPGNWRQKARVRDLVNLLQMIGDEEEKPRFHADLKKAIVSIMQGA